MSTKRVPAILIEQYVLGELSPERARHVELSDGFAERVAAIERDNRSFLERHPADVFSIRIANQVEAENSGPRREPTRRATTLRFLAFAVPGAAALLAVALVVFGGLGVGPGSGFETEITRMKGVEPRLAIYRAVGDDGAGAELLSDGAMVRQGDQLQIAYIAGERRFGMIVSIDGRGSLTLHHPIAPAGIPELLAGGEQPLPYGYRLDDAPDFEVFYFITSETRFEATDILPAIRDQTGALVGDPTRGLDLPSGYDVETVTLRKGE